MTETVDTLALYQKLMARHNELVRVRQELEPLWQTENELFLPQRSDIIGKISDWSSVGRKIWDGTPQHALVIYVDGIQGLMVSSAIKWFVVSLVDLAMLELDEVRLWLQKIEDLIYATLADSNFYSSLAEYLPDGASIGTASMFFEEIVGSNRVPFVVEHPKNVWLSQNRFGEIDEVHRAYELTAEEIAGEFGMEVLSPQCRVDAIQNPYRKYSILHIIQPNRKRLPGRLDASGMAFASYHMMAHEPVILRRAGFETIQGAFWRARRRHGYAYGISPAECALYDAKVLQAMSKTLMTAGQMAADPPWNIPWDMKGSVQIRPRGYNYYKQTGQVISPVNTGVNYPIGADREEKMRESVQRWFSVDFFLAMQSRNAQKTAAEIYAMQAEQAALLGPSIERLSEDSLDEIVRGVYDILAKQKRLPAAPAVLEDAKGEPVQIDYVGPIAQARKSLYVTKTIRQTVADIVQLAQVWPEAVDVVDPDELTRTLAEANQLPQKTIRGKDVVAQIRQARAKANQMMEQAQLAAAAADAAGKINKPTDPSSPLAALTGLGAQ